MAVPFFYAHRFYGSNLDFPHLAYYTKKSKKSPLIFTNIM